MYAADHRMREGEDSVDLIGMETKVYENGQRRCDLSVPSRFCKPAIDHLIDCHCLGTIIAQAVSQFQKRIGASLIGRLLSAAHNELITKAHCCWSSMS